MNEIQNGTRVMKPRLFKLLEQCIDSGITLGYSRAHKHTDSPTEQHLVHEISNAISNELHEWFSFDELGETPIRNLTGDQGKD